MLRANTRTLWHLLQVRADVVFHMWLLAHFRSAPTPPAGLIRASLSPLIHTPLISGFHTPFRAR